MKLIVKVISSPVLPLTISFTILIIILTQIPDLKLWLENIDPKDKPAYTSTLIILCYYGIIIRYFAKIEFNWRTAIIETILCAVLWTAAIGIGFHLFSLEKGSYEGIGILISLMMMGVFLLGGASTGLSFGAAYAFLWFITTNSVKKANNISDR